MPKNDPADSDPLELTGVVFDDPSGTSLTVMAECFADEFLNLGYTPAEVMDLFRSREHRLAHHAWSELGEVTVFAMVHGIAQRKQEIQENVRARRAARGV
jgi:hypothetical protein